MRRNGRISQIFIDRPGIDDLFGTLPIPTDEINARK